MPLSDRSRRWIRRVVYTLLGIPAAAALVLLIYIHTGHPDEMARELLVDALGNFLGRPVTIQSVELRYLPPGLIIHGFRSEQPLLEASYMEVSVSLRALLRGRIVVWDVDLFDPLIEWHLDTERFRRDQADQPAAARGQGRFASRLDLRRVRLHRARIMIGSEIRELSAEMEGLELHGDNQEFGFKGPWEGAVVFSRGRFVLGDLTIDGVAGSFAFEADPASIRTRRLTLRAEGIDIRATGQLQPGTPTRGRFEADARLDPESSLIRRPLPQIIAKNLACSLTLTLPGDGVKVSGTFTADQPSIDADRGVGQDGRIADGPLAAWAGSQATGTFLVESGRIEVQATIADLAGGHVEAGYVGVKHGAGDETPREHQVTISAKQLSLEEVLRHFELPGRQEITPSALLSGEATVRWMADHSDRMRGNAELIFDRAEGALPIWGAATVAWLGRRVTVEAASLTTEGSSVTLNGTVDGAMARTSLELTAHLASTRTNSLAAFLEQRFPALGAAKFSPSDLAGGIEADLEVGGTTALPEVEAGFRSDGIAVTLPTATIPLQSTAGTLSYRSDLLALDLSRIEATDLSAHGSLKFNPSTGEFLAADLDAGTVPADLLARVAGIDPERLTAAGTMRGKARYAGGEGQFELSSDLFSIGKLQLNGLAAQARLDGRRLLLDKGSVIFCGGKINVNGVVDLGGTTPSGGIDFSISEVDLAKVDEAYPGPALTGSLDAGGRLTFDGATRLDAKLTGNDIHVAGMDLGRLNGTLSGSINSTDDSLHLELSDEPGGITASATLSPDAVLAGEIRVRGFSLEEVRPLVPPGTLRGLEGDADGVITFSGPLKDPAGLVVVALLDRVHITAGNEALTNEQPVRLTIQDGFLTMAPMRLMGGKTDLTLGGSMTLSGTYDITARVAGTFDLALAELLFPEMSASGDGAADLSVTERGDLLSYEGTITLERGTMRHPSLPLPLENLRGRGEFTEQGQLKISELLFDTGGGHVSGAGFVRFEGASVPEIHLALSGKGVRAEIFQDMKAFFDAEISLDKAGSIYRLGGKVMIQRAVYTRSFGVAASNLLLRGREFAPEKESHGQAPEMLLDLDIEAEHDVWIRNDDAVIEASAHLSLDGTMDKPELSGRVSALEGGTYRFRDVTYNIVGGSIDFADLTRIDPLIDIEAVTRVQSYEVTLRITGRYSRPTFELTSDPPLPQRDVVWILITGHTLAEESSEASTTAAEGQVAAYLAAPMAGAVSAPLEKILGVSSFQIDPFFLNGAADPSARFTVTKRLEQGLLFTYSNSVGQSGQEIYQIEYNPGRIWDLIATRDLDGSVGIDFRFRRRWQGWKHLPGPLEANTGEGGLETGSRRVGSVAIVADHLIDSQASLLRKLPFDAGDPLRRGDLLEGRERLRQQYVQRGYPSAHIDLIEENAGTPDHPLTNVTMAIHAGALHDLEIHSDVLERGIRAAARQAWLEPILLEDLASEARHSALGLLRNKGYYSATVEAAITTPPAVSPSTEDSRLVTLDVKPGSKVQVKKITITGNHAMPEDRIRRQLLTRPAAFMSMFGRGLLKEGILEEDVDAIRGLYLANGYLSVRIAQPKVTLSEDGRDAEIELAITDEGQQSRIGDIVIEGEAPGVPGEELIKASGLSRTQVVTAAVISAATDRLRESLDENGYSRARVSAGLSGPPGETRVVFSIVPLERARIHEVVVEGNTRTRLRIVEREITMNRGDHLSRATLLATQRNLYRLGVFRSVQMETIPVEGKPGFVDVKIKVQEGSPILTAWGIGWDTEEKTRATFELANNNLFGTRRSAALFLRDSGSERRAQVSLRDPNLFGEKIETLLTGFGERKESDSFDLTRIGASAQLTRKAGKNTTLFGRYLLEDINLFNVRVSPEEITQNTVRLGSAGISLAHDTRDDIINPTRGGLTSVDFRVYHRALASEAQFNRMFISTSNFAEIAHGIVWASSARVGLLASRDEIPISERFFAGGDTTLRGFKYNEAGPVDLITGKPVGGQALFLLNQELRFPIYKALRGVLFYDTGNVFDKVHHFDTNGFRDVLGAGFRFDTPVGPFRVEYGHKLDRRRGETFGEFFFSIGQSF